MDTCLFFYFAKLCKVCLRSAKLDITHFMRVPPLDFYKQKKSKGDPYKMSNIKFFQYLSNFAQFSKIKLMSLVAPEYWFAKVEILIFEYCVYGLCGYRGLKNLIAKITWKESRVLNTFGKIDVPHIHMNANAWNAIYTTLHITQWLKRIL